jgi:uncharacterized protein
VRRPFILSRYHVVSEPLQDVQGGSPQVVLFGTRLAEGVQLDLSAYRALVANEFDRLDESLLSALVEAELLVPSGEDELATILARNRAAIADFRTFNVVLQPTAACQFACTYCSQRHDSSTLSDENVRRLLDLVESKLATGKFTTLKTSWHGGEPLLALPKLRRLSAGLQAIATKSGCGFTANITTNGYTLTPELAEELVAQHKTSEIQITLDGDAASHDRSRPRLGGAPTFDTVFDNIRQVAERLGSGANLVVRCNVYRENVANVTTLIDQLAAAGLQDKLKNVYFASLFDWGNHAGDEALGQTEFAAMELGWTVRLLSLGFRVSLLPQRVRVTCLAVKQDGFVVDPNGRLYNCPEPPLIESPPAASALPILAQQSCGSEANASEADYFALGTLTSSIDDSRRARLGKFLDLVERGETPCATCPVFGVCGGACPKHWLHGSPPCPAFKWNLPEKLRLQVAYNRRSAGQAEASRPLVDLCSD